MEEADIFIIGNGYDIAHGLPTSYEDFLLFSQAFMELYLFSDEYSNDSDYMNAVIKRYPYIKPCVVDKLCELFNSRIVGGNATHLNVKVLERLHNNLQHNIWLEYFLKLMDQKKIVGINWVDFEAEIERLIKCFDDIIEENSTMSVDVDSFAEFYKMLKISSYYKNGSFINAFCESFDELRSQIVVRPIPRLNDFINLLYDQLLKFTEALEIYLSYFVESLDIKEVPIIDNISPHHVISFNYTNTFERLSNRNAGVTYIHGMCRQINKNTGDFDSNKSNLVLGINEYLDELERNENNRFVIFKKFVQRIRNHNDTGYYDLAKGYGRNYSDWINSELGRNGELKKEPVKIVVFGHSLDVTDKDILQLFLQPEWSSVKIIAKDYEAEGELIENIIKIISEEVVIQKSSRGMLQVVSTDEGE